MKERIEPNMKASVLALALTAALTIGAATVAFAVPANNQTIDIVQKPVFIPENTDSLGAFFKDDGEPAVNTSEIRLATPVGSGSADRIEEKGTPTDGLPKGNVVYFDTEAERDEHFRALEANIAKGLDRYAGFEELYRDIDTSAPVTYIVK